MDPTDQEPSKDNIEPSTALEPIASTKTIVPHDPYLALRFRDFRLLLHLSWGLWDSCRLSLSLFYRSQQDILPIDLIANGL